MFSSGSGSGNSGGGGGGPPLACSLCGKQYQRSSHLRRHEASHAETRLKCPYCDKTFGRRDVWRKHSISCPNNRSHEPPPLTRRGQKPRACDACSRSRLACDNQLPCGRCVSRQSLCTYDRLHERLQEEGSTASSSSAVGAPSSAATIVGLSSSSRQISPHHAPSSGRTGGSSTPLSGDMMDMDADAEAEEDYESRHAEEDRKMDVSFLLSVTNPRADSMLETFFAEPHNDDVDNVEIQPEVGSELGLPASFVDGLTLSMDQGLFPWNVGQPPNSYMDDDSGYGHDTPSTSADTDHDRLDACLALIVHELHGLHDALTASATEEYARDYPAEDFDLETAHRVFTPENLRTFVAAYFRHTHHDFPLLHRPSFSMERSPPGLLLSVFLCGSMYAAPRDCVLAARNFFRIAEEYCFRKLRDEMQAFDEETAGEMSKEMQEVVQAALLVHCLQYTLTSAEARRRNRTIRLPVLVETMRLWKLAAAKHEVEEEGVIPEWSKYISEENRIRIGAWIFLSDCQQSGMFHCPALVSVHEMVGDVACTQELWDARNATEFTAIVRARGRDVLYRGGSIRACMDALMADDWRGPADFPLSHVALHDLHLLMFTFHSAILSARFMCLLRAAAPAILRATTRWNTLWDLIAARLTPEQMLRCGFSRHSRELCWLARKMIHLSVTGDESAEYFQTVGHDSLAPLHAFLRDYKDV